MDCIFGICKDLSEEQEALQKFNRLFEFNPNPTGNFMICSLLDALLVAIGGDQ